MPTRRLITPLLLAAIALPLASCSYDASSGYNPDRDYTPHTDHDQAVPQDHNHDDAHHDDDAYPDYYHHARVVRAANGNFLVTLDTNKRVSFDREGKVLGQVNADAHDIRRARRILNDYRDARHIRVVQAANGNYLVTLDSNKRVSFDREGKVLGQVNANAHDIRRAARALARHQSRH